MKLKRLIESPLPIQELVAMLSSPQWETLPPDIQDDLCHFGVDPEMVISASYAPEAGQCEVELNQNTEEIRMRHLLYEYPGSTLSSTQPAVLTLKISDP